MNKSFALLLLSIIPVLTYGQDELFTKLKTKFPDEPAVFVERSEVMNIQMAGDSLNVYSDVFEEILHLKEQSDSYSSRRVYGSHFNQVQNLKAKTLLWDRNRYREMVVSDFKKNSDRGQGVFYDDSYYYSFNYPSVAQQNRTQLEYRELTTNVKFISGFVFQSYLAHGKSTYVIKAPNTVELHHEIVNDPDKWIKFRKYEKGSVVTYEWTAYDIPAFRSEGSAPSLRYFAPHVICYVKSYQNKSGTVRVLSDVNDLYKWYRSLIKNVNKEHSPDLVEVVNDLKLKSSNERDLVRDVFYWVQDHIKYIAFEQGMRGLIPHSGSYVCEKRYGDCKDMANLIVDMLSIAGVKAYHTWIGTRDLPYRYSNVPTPLVDNHMIATWISPQGEYVFLDATGDHSAFGMPTSMIQGKEALISIDDNRYEIREVPVISANVNIMTDSMQIKLDGNSMIGAGTSLLAGYAKVFGNYELDRAVEDDVRKYVVKLLGKGSNKFFLDSYEVKDLHDRDLPTRIDYTFRIADYFQSLGDELFVNLNLNKDLYNDYINVALRKYPIENEYQYLKEEVIKLEIPQGFDVEYVPEDFKADADFIGCEISYRVEKNVIVYRKLFKLNYLLLEPSSFETFNNAVKKISSAYKESVILKKK